MSPAVQTPEEPCNTVLDGQTNAVEGILLPQKQNDPGDTCIQNLRKKSQDLKCLLQEADCLPGTTAMVRRRFIIFKIGSVIFFPCIFPSASQHRYVKNRTLQSNKLEETRLLNCRNCKPLPHSVERSWVQNLPRHQETVQPPTQHTSENYAAFPSGEVVWQVVFFSFVIQMRK